MSSGAFSVSIQKGLIGDELNSTILYVFLWGIYTVVYVGTVYLYLSQKSSRNQGILWAISLSYWAYSALVIVSWYRDQSAVVNHSETRDALFSALYQGSQWPVLMADIMSFILAAVADGILIWRCYHVSGRSFRAILFPGFLLSSEIGKSKAPPSRNFSIDFTSLRFKVIDVITVGMKIKYLNPVKESQAYFLNRLTAAQAFVTFTTTLASTTIIAYRIYTTTREIPGNSKQLLVRILEILVQSAGAYSLVAVAFAISGVVPETTSDLVSWVAAGDYTNALFLFVSGVAPTVLVARVAILDENDVYASSTPTASGPSRLSGLRFHVRTTQGSADSRPQLSDRISRIDRSVEDPQAPEMVKERDHLINIS